MRSVLTSAFAVGLISRVVLHVATFAQVMLAARYLGLADFGTYALAWAITVVTVSFVYTGFYQALLRSDDFDRDRDTAFVAMVVIGALGTGVLIAAALLTGDPLSGAGLVFLTLAPLSTVRALIAWNEALLVRRKSVRVVSVSPSIAEVISLVAVWLSLESGFGLMALVVGRATTLAVDFVIVVGAARIWPGRAVSRAAFRDLKRTALPLWGTSAMGNFSIYGADFILGAFLSPAAVGAYRAGARISQTAADLVMQPMTLLSWSRFTSLSRDKKQSEVREAWLENMALSAAVLWPVLTAVVLLAEPLIVVLFDESWMPAVAVVTVLSISRGVGFLSTLLEPVMTSLDRGGEQLRVRIFGAVVLLATLLAFGRVSAVHASYAHLLASVAVSIYALSVMHRALGFTLRQVVRCFAPSLGLSAATAWLILMTPDWPPGGPSVLDLGLTCLSLAVLWLVGLGLSLWRRVLVLPTP